MRFSRLENLIGQEQLSLLKDKKVIVFGLGGVGSFVAEALVRSGIGQVDVVDYDKIDESNINRQIIALENTVGEFKTDVFQARARLINPDLKIHTYREKVSKENIKEIIIESYDYVLDCIDDVQGKLALASFCQETDQSFMLALGFANKFHPEMIEISTLKHTSVCPLAKAMRKQFRDHGLSLSIPCVYSKEKPAKVLDQSILGSTAFCPSTAGLMMASFVINSFVKEID